ncbi:hypothetical protein UY3_03572 [Chelonia mydas]|uniref:Uncharacterized protein n=1 Tax=Chelonia mydas TaxID=8469 RepID=M7CEF0_CHEMY|nr:hypothetical protein UY3_03572 [Chelonia mydas]
MLCRTDGSFFGFRIHQDEREITGKSNFDQALKPGSSPGEIRGPAPSLVIMDGSAGALRYGAAKRLFDAEKGSAERSRIFEADAGNGLHQRWFGFSGFVGMAVLLDRKTNEFRSICPKKCRYTAGDHSGVKSFGGTTRLPVIDIN